MKDRELSFDKAAGVRRILVLDGDMVPALTIVRSLGGQYIVDVASPEERPIAGYSSRSRSSHVYPDPLESEQAFLIWLEEHCSRNHYDLVVPVTERTLVPLSRHRERFSHLRIAMASRDSLDIALDKSATFALAAELGVAVPVSHLVEQIEDLDKLQGSLEWPVVLKPVRSVSTTGTTYARHSVSYAQHPDALRRELVRLLPLTPVVLQSYFSGVGVGVEVIAREGEILYAFQHQRIHEVPLSGGGSSYRMSTDLVPELMEAAESLIQALAWHGVAMVEFKWQPASREYRLMEINGRFWGSLPLAQAAGADFPGMLAELEFEGRVSETQPYRRGVYCRNLARDLAWLEQVLRRDAGPVATIPPFKSVVRDCLQVFLPRHHFDVQSLTDPIPGMVDVWRSLKRYTGRVHSLLSETWFTAMQRLSWRNGKVREKLVSAETVLFVCYGNINRSALAELLFLEKVRRTSVHVRSAGFHKEASRSMDPRMSALAADRDIFAGSFASTTLDPELLASSDVVFVMEKTHHDRVLDMYPKAKGKVFLLGACLNSGRCPRGEIADPYGRDEGTYRRCFAQVDDAMTEIAGELNIGID